MASSVQIGYGRPAADALADRYPPLVAADYAEVPPDVACVAYYRTIRSQARADARQIGYGVNRMAPPASVRSWLGTLYRHLLTEHVTDYESAADLRERALVAQLAGEYLGVDGLGPEHIAFANGTTEAISMLLSYAGRRGMTAVLPLPLYCSFEQSAARHGVPVSGYYNAVGDYQPVGVDGDGGRVIVDIAPNGVSGAWFAAPAAARETDLRIVDHVFALPTFEDPARFLAQLRMRVGDLSQGAVLLSPSKDLSIPGLRCGTIITKNPQLMRYLRWDRFERGYSVQVGLAGIAASHLALLLTVLDGRLSAAARGARLGELFAAADLPGISTAGLLAFCRHVDRMRAHFLDSAAIMSAGSLLRALPESGTSIAGYSGLRALSRDFASPAELTSWTIAAGAAGLKLNTQYLFGGDPQLWQRLYPGRYALRVNFSVPHRQLRENLSQLARLLAPERARTR